jgi:colanic acid/amylovoran biosynthesis glycosyltransferase
MKIQINTPNICIVQPQENAYSETFLKNQADRLKGNVTVLHGDWYPIYEGKINIVQLFIKEQKIRSFFLFLLKFLPKILYNRLPIDLQLNFNNQSLHKKALERYLIKKKTDVVLANFSLKAVIMMEVCEKLKIPLISHFHGGDQPDMPSLASYSSDFKNLFRQNGPIVTVSNTMTKRLISFGAQKYRTHLFPYGVNTSLFNPTTPSKNDEIFICVGRLTEKKGAQLTILAFNDVVKTFPNAKLVFIGDGKLLDACQSIVKSLRIDHAVYFKGVLPPSKVADELSKARAFVLHSVTTLSKDREGAPNVIMEASSCSLPIVSTKHEGIIDIVDDGKTGYLCDEFDVIQMAINMKKYLEHPKLADEMGRKGRLKIESQFSLNRYISDLDLLIKNTISKNS